MRTIVFLPGLPLSREMYADAQQALDPRRTIALDHPGFGGQPLEGELELEDYVDALERSLEPLEGELVLAGVSFGALLAALLAARARDRRIVALVLSNTQGQAPSAQESQMFDGIADAALQHGSAALSDQLCELLLSEQTRASQPQIEARVREMVCAAPPDAIAGAFRALARRPGPASYIPNIQVPVLVSFGAEDRAVPLGDAQLLAGLLSDARERHIAGAGHFPPLETPIAYAAALTEFLDSLGVHAT